MSHPSRTEPPLVRRVLFRLRLLRLGPERRDWVEREVERPSFVAWTLLFQVWVAAVVAGVGAAITGEFRVGFVIAYLVVGLVVSTVPALRAWNRKTVLDWQRGRWDRQAGGKAPAP